MEIVVQQAGWSPISLIVLVGMVSIFGLILTIVMSLDGGWSGFGGGLFVWGIAAFCAGALGAFMGFAGASDYPTSNVIAAIEEQTEYDRVQRSGDVYTARNGEDALVELVVIQVDGDTHEVVEL